MTEILVKICNPFTINVPGSEVGRRTAAATDTRETDSDPAAVGPGGITRMRSKEWDLKRKVRRLTLYC